MCLLTAATTMMVSHVYRDVLIVKSSASNLDNGVAGCIVRLCICLIVVSILNVFIHLQASKEEGRSPCILFLAVRA